MHIYRSPYTPLATKLSREGGSRRQESPITGQDQFRGMNRFMAFIITMAIIPWFAGEYQIFGFNITGWTWVIPLVLSSLICLGNIGRISFPFRLWSPWVGLLCFYWFLGRYNPSATQSFLQTISPVLVGCAASIFRPNQIQLDSIVKWITRLTWIAWIALLIRYPMVLVGLLPGHGFMVGQMIGFLLLGACYSAFYACGSLRHLYYYLAMIAITLISLTRGPIVAMLSCLPFTPAPLKMQKRLILCTCLAVCAIVAFNTDRVQHVMFFSGHGEISDLYWGNPDLATSGRSFMWEVLWDGVKASPWFGNGWNSHRVALISAGCPMYLPHNDWLKLTYDMGFIGAGVYMGIMVWQILALIKIARNANGAHRMLTFGAATAFIPYMLIMLTDNVVLYVQFFGNLHFALIGIVYSAIKYGRVAELPKEIKK